MYLQHLLDAVRRKAFTPPPVPRNRRVTTANTTTTVSQQQALIGLFFGGFELALAGLLGRSTAALQTNITNLLPIAGPMGGLYLALGQLAAFGDA